MMVTIEQVKRGIANYADKEIVNRLPVGTVKRVLVGTGIALALRNSVEPFLTGDMASTLGIIKDDMVDLETLRDVLKTQIPVDGVRVEIPLVGVNLTFKPSDVDTVYNEINAVQEA